MFPRVTCPCCGHQTLSETGGFQVCLACLWEDDGEESTKRPERWSGGPNGISVTEGQERYRREGRVHEDSPPNFCARAPRDNEPKDPAWRPYNADARTPSPHAICGSSGRSGSDSYTGTPAAVEEARISSRARRKCAEV